MARWHEPFCAEPTVEVDDDLIPRCKTCDASALGYVTRVRADDSGSLPSIPEDEAPGHYNLFWPSSVPYKNDQKLKFLLDGQTEATCSDEANSLTGLSKPEDECHATLDPIYGRRLSSSQIRLAVISPPPKEKKSLGFPVHINLESHEDLRCPEYDAVSYTWGGEDNNYQRDVPDEILRVHPVYVGDYWDVILQTKNCHSMLNYLRPSRGLRTLWIDAVCINQDDLKERQTQVAKMRDIYTRSSQVWLWLGDDIVCNSLENPPARYWLHKVGSGSITSWKSKSASSMMENDCHPVTISMLLQRRYFSRVWVVQELALAPRVLIPVGDVLLLADHTTQSKLKILSGTGGGWKWDQTQAPWLQFMAQGPLEGLDLWEIINLTSGSEATDARDKLYGTLGLISMGAGNLTLQPDYSISIRHLTIGLIAHMIFNLRMVSLLYQARGIGSKAGPSWLPNLDIKQDWEETFNRPLDIKSDSFNRQCLELCPHLGVKEYERIKLTVSRKERHKGYPWHLSWSIDSTNGALSLNLMKVLIVASTPTRTAGSLSDFEQNEGLKLYRIEQGEKFSMDTASRHPLSEIIQKNDEIFVLAPAYNWKDKITNENGYHQDVMYVVLRKFYDKTYRLVVCLPYITFVIARSTRKVVESWQAVRIPKTVAELMVEAKDWLEGNTEADRYLNTKDWRKANSEFPNYTNLFDNACLREMFPGFNHSSRWWFLPILAAGQGMFSLLSSDQCKKFKTSADGKFYSLTFEKAGWDAYKQILRVDHRSLNWDWYNAQEERWEALTPHESRLPNVQPDSESHVHIRCPVYKFKHIPESLNRFLGVDYLWESGFLGRDMSEFEARLQAGPKGDDYVRIAWDRHHTDPVFSHMDIGTSLHQVYIQ